MVVALPAATGEIQRRQHQTTIRRTQDRSFRPDVEGLRAIAVLLVLLDHAGLAAISGGYVGVDVFFVLSGFLITGLLLKEHERDGGVSLTRFYARRARRLLPAGSLVLVATVIGSYLYLGESRANRVAEDARWATLFASNFRFLQQGTNYLDAQLPPSPLQHFWSLAVEEQFYAVWPALIILLAAFGKSVPLRLKLGVALSGVITASLLWSIHQTTTDGTAAYFSPFPRACELGAGALLAVVAHRLLPMPRAVGVMLSWSGIAMVLAAAVLFEATTAFPGYAVALPVTGTVLAVAGGTIAPGGGAELLLKQWPFQWLGKLSYSLYLWHWPILVIAAGRAGRDLTLGESLALCGVAVALSAATYFVLENPVRDSAILKQRAPAFSVGFGAALVVLCFGFSAWMIDTHKLQGEVLASNAMPATYPSSDEVLQAVSDAPNITDWPAQPPRIKNPAYIKDCDVTRKDTTSSACVFGDPNATRTAVVFGDSHAAMWIPALDVIGKQAGWRVVQLTKPGCQAPDFPRYSEVLKREYTECAEEREWALDQIAMIRPDVVLIASSSKDVQVMVDGKPTSDGAEEAWAAGLGSVIDRIRPVAGRIVVLAETPYPAEPGIDCLTAHPGDVPACNTPRADAVPQSFNDTERLVATQKGVEYVDTIPWFCTNDTCPAVIAGLTTHRDSIHVAENYAVWLSTALGTATGLLPEGTQLRPA